MVSKGSKHIVLWPRYFDARSSRQAGRRVPAALGVKDPDAAWIASAARKAGFEATVEEGARHPSIPYKVTGRVLVGKTAAKEAVIRSVAEQMARSGAP